MATLLLVDPDKCTACHRCVLACSAEHEGVFAPALARLGISMFSLHGYSVPSVCFQCPNPDCAKACPTKAISKNEDGLVVVDESKCDGNGACVEACPYGMILVGAKGKAFKCDLCGGDPACVKECHPQALTFVDPDKAQIKARALQMKEKGQGTPEQKRRNLATALKDKALEQRQ